MNDEANYLVAMSGTYTSPGDRSSRTVSRKAVRDNLG